jgi:RNA polymerase sigma-70 factor (ECF subfamily)
VPDDTHSQTAPIATGSEFAEPQKLAIGTIAREHYDSVFRFCARRVGIDRAADAAQETFVTAQRVLPKFRGESAVSTWLFGIAHNECRRICRKERIMPVTVDLDHADCGVGDGERQLVDRQALTEAMLLLSDSHREVVVMHELDGLTYDEAAAILGIPVGTVKSRLHHAFLQLRKSLTAGEGVA